jgi:hypothetical protein
MRLERMLLLTLLVSCSDEPKTPEHGPKPTTTYAPATAVPHGDHNPHHGGYVLMHGDLHFEVVLDLAGHHRIYLTDAVRNDLPASAASAVSMTVLRPGEPPEVLSPEIDEFGESWVAEGRPVPEQESRALVGLTYEGAPYEIELPFLKPPEDPEAPDPHATPRP